MNKLKLYIKFKDFKILYHSPVRKNFILPDDQFLDHQVKSSSPAMGGQEGLNMTFDLIKL